MPHECRGTDEAVDQTDRVLQATVGMYGDMQGIAGKTLQEIKGLEMKALEAPATERSSD